MQVGNIICYVVCGLTCLLTLFCFFKVLNVSRKVHSVSDFINGEIFSSKFHQILTNYFSNEQYTKILLDPLTPYIRDVIMKQCYVVEESQPVVVKDMAGVFYVD